MSEENKLLKHIFRQSIEDIKEFIIFTFRPILKCGPQSVRDLNDLYDLWQENANQMVDLMLGISRKEGETFDKLFQMVQNKSEDSYSDAVSSFESTTDDILLEGGLIDTIKKTYKWIGAVLGLSLTIMVLILSQVFIKNNKSEYYANWMEFLSSGVVLVILWQALFDLHYCYCGRPKIEDLTLDIRLYDLLIILDISMVLRNMLVYLPLSGLSIGLLLFVGLYFSRLCLQIIIIVNLRIARKKSKQLEKRLKKLFNIKDK